jgi:lysine/ornithine N-monooxygenase
VKFENGIEKNFDAIVFATGYKSAANKWLKVFSLFFFFFNIYIGYII